MSIEAGDKAPAFTLQTDGGGTVSLAKLKGKKVILYFYPKDDTPGCTKEACGFRDDWRALEKSGTVVLGVSADSGESHQKFIAKYKLPFPLLSDKERKVMTTYGAWGEKTRPGGEKFMGVIRSHVVIDENGKVIDTRYNVKADASMPEALSALSA